MSEYVRNVTNCLVACVQFCDELNHPTIPNVRKWSKMDSPLCWAQIASADEDNVSGIEF